MDEALKCGGDSRSDVGLVMTVPSTMMTQIHGNRKNYDNSLFRKLNAKDFPGKTCSVQEFSFLNDMGPVLESVISRCFLIQFIVACGRR
jgi:hypothetical protein